MKGTLLNYAELNKSQKRQVISFIRKVYDNSVINVRDIISNEYQALLHEGKLTGVSYRLPSPQKPQL